jgi:hypothetical protein
MAVQPNFSERFVRRTQLSANEYHKKFLKLDEEIIEAVTSAEADRVTPLMSKIYLRLINAPRHYLEREGVLRFEAECREGNHVKAWTVLCEVLGVASATASKSLAWLHEQGIIGYFAGKNGVGIRVFINRASSSIGVRTASPGQKILRFPPASSHESRASRNEPAFKDSYAVSEVSDTDINPRAPKNGAETEQVGKKVSEATAPQTLRPAVSNGGEEIKVEADGRHRDAVSLDEIVARLKCELGLYVKSAATQAAVQTAAQEVARTREWFETKALPKAVRVAQHETYNLLRKHGPLDERGRRARADMGVGRTAVGSNVPPAARRLSHEEVRETAESCVAMLETQGRSIDVTLSEISSEGGGWLLPEDAPRVREVALGLLGERGEGR